MDQIVVEVGLPDRCLSPNVAAHWAKEARAAKALRDSVYNTVKLTMPQAASQRWEAAEISYDFYHELVRNRDDDNYIRMMKSARDAFSPTRNGRRGKVIPGLGIVPDDTYIKQGPVEFHIDTYNPRVVITLTRKECSHD